MNSAASKPLTMVSSSREHPLVVDSEIFEHYFDERPFLIRHHLVDHPLFAVERLLDLARALPETSVEYNEGNIPINMGHHESPRTGLSAEETIRRIKEAHSWMVLKYVEKDPDYSALLDQCLDQIKDFSEPIVPGMCKREGFIFLSSPNSTTPFHVDPEHNFLLQIKGRKLVSIFDPTDATVVTEDEIERGLFGRNRNLSYKTELQARGQFFELDPGMGLHFPVAAPHWVKNRDDVSISFSITFRSHKSERCAAVRKFNSGLRERGFNPKPPGYSAMRDAAKYHAHRVLRRVHTVFQSISNTPSKRSLA